MKMGKTLAVTALLCAAVFTFCGCRSVDAAAENKEKKAMNMQDVYQFLKDAGVYYIATVDGSVRNYKYYDIVGYWIFGTDYTSARQHYDLTCPDNQ